MTLYPWLNPLWQNWQTMLMQNTVPNAMLLNAAEGTGVETLVKRFVAALVCSNSDDEACGFCHSCGLSKTDHHPDIHWIVPEKEGKAISVDQIREANRYALESSQLGGKRVIIVHPAESMNESASNALLKTLETPPEKCVFILLSNDKHKLLPTIISRCQTWQLPVMSKEVLENWLQTSISKPVQLDWFSLNMYAQSPLKALAFIENKKQAEWEKLLNLLLVGVQNHSYSLVEVQTFFKEEPLEKVIWLLYLFSELQKASFGVCDYPTSNAFQQLATHINYNQAYAHYQSLQKVYRSLHSSPGLNAELLIMDWYLSFV
ncbi:MAG: DNA polymerase III subunit delta' [Vibrio sp.]